MVVSPSPPPPLREPVNVNVERCETVEIELQESEIDFRSADDGSGAVTCKHPCAGNGGTVLQLISVNHRVRMHLLIRGRRAPLKVRTNAKRIIEARRKRNESGVLLVDDASREGLAVNFCKRGEVCTTVEIRDLRVNGLPTDQREPKEREPKEVASWKIICLHDGAFDSAKRTRLAVSLRADGNVLCWGRRTDLPRPGRCHEAPRV